MITEAVDCGCGIYCYHTENERAIIAKYDKRYKKLKRALTDYADDLLELGDDHVDGCEGQADCARCVYDGLVGILRVYG